MDQATHCTIRLWNPHVSGGAMKSLVSVAKRCAYCNEPFRITEQGVEAHTAGIHLVCNEFCAQAIREETYLIKRAS
jgi:hypothetical protein